MCESEKNKSNHGGGAWIWTCLLNLWVSPCAKGQKMSKENGLAALKRHAEEIHLWNELDCCAEALHNRGRGSRIPPGSASARARTHTHAQRNFNSTPLPLNFICNCYSSTASHNNTALHFDHHTWWCANTYTVVSWVLWLIRLLLCHIRRSNICYNRLLIRAFSRHYMHLISQSTYFRRI